jgi:hypothetical protein
MYFFLKIVSLILLSVQAVEKEHMHVWKFVSLDKKSYMYNMIQVNNINPITCFYHYKNYFAW